MTTKAAAATRGPAKGPKVLLILGGVSAVVGVIMVIVGGLLFSTNLFQTVYETTGLRDSLELEVPVPGTGEVFLKVDTYEIVTIGNRFVRGPNDDPDGNDSTRTSVR